jgi:hypothetical protein
MANDPVKEKQKRMEEDIQDMKDKQLYENHVKEQEEKEKEQEEDSPAYRVYNDDEIENLAGGAIDRKEEEIEELPDEELTEENIDGKLSLLNNIEEKKEKEETKTILYHK